MNEQDLLGRAAAAHGIEPRYEDAFGKFHETSDDVARALLTDFGIPATNDDDLARALQAEAATLWSNPVDPTLVIRDDEKEIRLRIPARQNGDSYKLEIEWENGEIEHHWYWAPELQTLESVNFDGTFYISKRLPLPNLKLGYHRLRIYRMKEPELERIADAKLIVCPRRVRPVERRAAGLGVTLYGLRSARNWGCGDFTDLRAVIDSFAAAGAAFIALNPLHAIANRSPYNTSPYLPQCIFYRNFIYLDVEKCAEESGGLALDDAMRQEIEELRAGDLVEYERVAKLKLTALGRIFEQFPGSREFDDYAWGEGQQLEDFAVFCTLDEEMHRRDPNVWIWTDWPKEYHSPHSGAVLKFADEHRHRVTFFKFLQWHLCKQAAEAQAYALEKGMSIGLYHDLALATDRYGADLWSHPEFYVTSCRVGAPPDELAPHGQDWAFPPPDRDAHKRDGYALFAKSIRKAAQSGGALRIDHVMRFFRLYTIPAGIESSRGVYVRDYAQDLVGVLALESVRHNFAVIGEDLGTVTGEVRQALAEAGILSYRLLWFERNRDGSFFRPDQYPHQALAAATTHDLPTLAGFALGRDIEARKNSGLVDEAGYEHQKNSRKQELENLNRSLGENGFPDNPLGFILATPCLLALVNQEDLTGETEQQNLPASTWQYPNWRRKMRIPVEQLGAAAEAFAEAVKRSGRA